VFEHPWAGDGAVFGDVTDERDGQVAVFRDADEGGGDLAHLRRSAREAVAQCSTSAVVRSVMARAARSSLSVTGLRLRVIPVASLPSMTVPHDWHSPQRPTHLMEV